MHACVACGFYSLQKRPAQNELRSTDAVVVKLLYSNFMPFRADAVLLVIPSVSQHVAPHHYPQNKGAARALDHSD